MTYPLTAQIRTIYAYTKKTRNPAQSGAPRLRNFVCHTTINLERNCGQPLDQ